VMPLDSVVCCEREEYFLTVIYLPIKRSSGYG
jgi:hypothetical protein